MLSDDQKKKTIVTRVQIKAQECEYSAFEAWACHSSKQVFTVVPTSSDKVSSAVQCQGTKYDSDSERKKHRKWSSGYHSSKLWTEVEHKFDKM